MPSPLTLICSLSKPSFAIGLGGRDATFLQYSERQLTARAVRPVLRRSVPMSRSYSRVMERVFGSCWCQHGSLCNNNARGSGSDRGMRLVRRCSEMQ